MKNDSISFNVNDSGVATLCWDMPDRDHNALDESVCDLLCTLIARVASDPEVRAILVCSAKADFIVNTDLAWLPATQDAATLFARVMRLNRALRTLESCGKPVAVALPGAALGAGMAVALCGHYRIAADRPDARFGFPEVTHGLVPGAGATQRLPRLIGVQQSLPFLLEGKLLSAGEAYSAGMIHAVVTPGTELHAAHLWLTSALTQPCRQPWDMKAYKVPGGAVSSPSVQQILMVTNALVHAKAKENVSLPRDILSCVYEGLSTDIDTALATEARYLVRQLSTRA